METITTKMSLTSKELNIILISLRKNRANVRIDYGLDALIEKIEKQIDKHVDIAERYYND